VIRWVRGTTSSYTWATQAGLSRLGSNRTLIASALVVVGSRRAMTASSLPLSWDVVRLHHVEWGAQKPGPIAGAKLCTRDARRELYDIFCNFVGSVFSPLLANIYLNELDRYMERYTSLPVGEKEKRRRQGIGNFTFSRYADDFVVLCNGGKRQAEDMREELHQFLKSKLRLELSREKTKVTHLNDGFNFLGFRIYRGLGGSGTTTKIVIPDEAIDKVRVKIHIALAPATQKDSVNTKIAGLNRLIRGWCQYYQYTSKASTQFSQLGNELFWEMAHWLGRKFKIPMPVVMQRFKRDNTFVSGDLCLLKPTEFPSLKYQQRFFKPNPYLTQERVINRENLPVESYWSGYEARPGMADLRPLILERDEGVCQNCGIMVTSSTAEIDHIRPVRRYKRPINATTLDNLWTLCKNCHQEKTKSDRQAESRMR